MDLAEHLFNKASLPSNNLGPAVAENLADLLYEIGKNFLQKKQYEMAVRWLERSLDALSCQDLDRLSPDAGDLRLSIMHDLGQRTSPTDRLLLIKWCSQIPVRTTKRSCHRKSTGAS